MKSKTCTVADGPFAATMTMAFPASTEPRDMDIDSHIVNALDMQKQAGLRQDNARADDGRDEEGS
jgi:hypothetical protein